MTTFIVSLITLFSTAILPASASAALIHPLQGEFPELSSGMSRRPDEVGIAQPRMKNPLVSILGEDSIWPKQEIVSAEHILDLTNRLPTEYGSQVFADNILLSLHYLKGDVQLPVDWEAVRQPFEVNFTLQPGEVFAFHANTLPEFAKPAVTMNSRFYMEEGYKALAGLGGNGVCHLASLINWVATEADLEVVAKANHDFWPVPGVPRENGTSIRSQVAYQNLYIRNSQGYTVTFNFKADGGLINLKIVK